MKYIDEYRDFEITKNLVNAIESIAVGNWSIMEICGGQTHTIMKYNIEELLPDSITLLHGPGCPVCVTPLEKIDKALNVGSRNNVILTTYGDMMRVPGSKEDLLSIKANGADIRMVYSPLDAVNLAEINPDKEVVFFAVGFETTAPANAISILEAKKRGLKNFSLLGSHVLVPPAIESLLSDGSININGFLAAGHVCTVMGYNDYYPLVDQFSVPIIVTGFEPVDILHGIFMVLKQLEDGRAELENQYSRSVSRFGNKNAKEILEDVFEVVDMTWRGIGKIPNSGFGISEKYSEYNAEKKFDLEGIHVDEPDECIAGEILQGKKKPIECPAFGKKCKPENPLGAPMVSSEGACAAYFHYK